MDGEGLHWVGYGENAYMVESRRVPGRFWRITPGDVGTMSGWGFGASDSELVALLPRGTKTGALTLDDAKRIVMEADVVPATDTPPGT